MAVHGRNLPYYVIVHILINGKLYIHTENNLTYVNAVVHRLIFACESLSYVID